MNNGLAKTEQEAWVKYKGNRYTTLGEELAFTRGFLAGVEASTLSTPDPYDGGCPADTELTPLPSRETTAR